MGLGGNGDSQGLANSGGLAKRRACETCWTWWRWAGARTCWAGGLGQSAGFARLAVPGRQLDLADSAAARIWWLWGGLALDLYTSGVAHLADKGGIAEFGRLVGQRAPVNCACGGLRGVDGLAYLVSVGGAGLGDLSRLASPNALQGLSGLGRQRDLS